MWNAGLWRSTPPGLTARAIRNGLWFIAFFRIFRSLLQPREITDAENSGKDVKDANVRKQVQVLQRTGLRKIEKGEFFRSHPMLRMPLCQYFPEPFNIPFGQDRTNIKIASYQGGAMGNCGVTAHNDELRARISETV